MVKRVEIKYKFTALNEITPLYFVPFVRYAYFCGTNIGGTTNEVDLYVYPSMALNVGPNPITEINKYCKYLNLSDNSNAEKEFYEPPSPCYVFFKCVNFQSDFIMYLVGR